MLISERVLSNFWPPGPKCFKSWVLSYSNNKKVLLNIIQYFLMVRCKITYFHFFTSNSEQMTWCRRKNLAWVWFGLECCLLATLCESRTEHFHSLCSINRCVYSCLASLTVLLWGPRKIWTIHVFEKIDYWPRWGIAINKAIKLVWNKEIQTLSWLYQAVFLITMFSVAEP